MFIASNGRFGQHLLFKHITKPTVGICHKPRFPPHQLFLLKMAFHHLQGFQVFCTGGHHAVVFVIAYAVDVVGTGIEEGKVVVLGVVFFNPPAPLKRGSLPHKAVEIGYRLQQGRTVGLGVIVFVQQFGQQKVGVMAVVGGRDISGNVFTAGVEIGQ